VALENIVKLAKALSIPPKELFMDFSYRRGEERRIKRPESNIRVELL
jgi:hypothetical protein